MIYDGSQIIIEILKDVSLFIKNTSKRKLADGGVLRPTLKVWVPFTAYSTICETDIPVNPSFSGVLPVGHEGDINYGVHLRGGHPRELSYGCNGNKPIRHILW